VAIDLNDEIVQDFLVEAGEILELLNEQLVDLESSPDDNELLNSVFRSFHTIKGGAGFLAITPLVDVCHKAENVFDLLRNGQRCVDANLMDVVLEVLDVVNAMFAEIQQAQDPTPAAATLIQKLEQLSVPGDAGENVAEPVTAEGSPEAESVNAANLPAEEESVPEAAAETEESADSNAHSDEITDEEFEALLDQLHGEGSFNGKPDVSLVENEKPVTSEASATDSAAGQGSDEITDDEFEALLDELQSNKQGAFADQPAAKSAQPEPERKPEKPALKVVESVAPKPKPAAASKSNTPPAETTVRVETSTLDNIMNMVGELVLLRNRLTTLESEIGHDEMSKTVNNLDVVTADLQASVMKTRMQPIKKVFGRFPRVVRDLARSLNKEVLLEMIGEDTDLDKNLVEALADPLVHLVRNSVDHGIEMPDEREAAGKPRQGTIVLSAAQEGDHILLTIADDGKGLDVEALKRKIITNGLMDAEAVARLDDNECFNLIFLPGFSTKDEISDISGRGVGMDVVKTRINQLNGTIDIDSQLGKGTTISIKVPLTLAIMPTLMVMLGKNRQIFALPLVNVNEIIDLDDRKINVVDGQQVIVVRDRPLPLFYLNNLLTRNNTVQPEGKAHVVVVTIGKQHIGLLVDKLIGREEVVIKPLGALLQGTRGLAGATITGDGKIALILDLPNLVQSCAGRY